MIWNDKKVFYMLHCFRYKGLLAAPEWWIALCIMINKAHLEVHFSVFDGSFKLIVSNINLKIHKH